VSSSLVLSSGSLLYRELIRFFRQRNRVIGALATPLIFWLLIGAGFSSSFKPPSMPSEMSAIQYLFPGTLTLIVLFTSIFSTISIIEDRREGFLQSVLVAPISNASIVLGKILGGTAIAVIQAALFLILAPFIGISFTLVSFAAVLGVTLLVAFALTGLGFVIAWKMDSTQGFHAIMNLFLMPMWMLSGSFFPVSGAPQWLHGLMILNPLTYGVAALRRTLYLGNPSAMGDLPSLSVSITITILFALVFFIASLWIVGRRYLPKS
jgi:ABC-2 type transport system permease protein